MAHFVINLVFFILISRSTCSPFIDSEKHVKVEDLWNHLDVKPKPFLTMPFRDYRIPIYEHRYNDQSKGHLNRYFYSPVPVFDHTNVTVNEASDRPEIKFRIEMWSARLEREVAFYLKEAIGKEIKLHQLQVVPFERLILVTNQMSSEKFWKKYELEKSLWFSLPCSSLDLCRKSLQKIKSNPKDFAQDLTLKFTVDSGLALRGQLSVNIDEIAASIHTYRTVREDHQDVVYVAGEVLDRLVSETVDYIEKEMLNRQQILMSDTLLRKQLLKIFSRNKVSKNDVSKALMFKQKKPAKKGETDDYQFEDYEVKDESNDGIPPYLYEIDLKALENPSSYPSHRLNYVYSLSMMSTSVKVNDSSLYKTKDEDVGDYNQKDMRGVNVTLELKEQFTELEKQLRNQLERTKDDVTRTTRTEVHRLYHDIRKIKWQNCPLHIGSQSYCEGVPFFGCYCFSVDKKRHYLEAASLCKDYGMRLVSLDTRIEKDQFVAIIERERKLKELMFWTSGVRVNQRDHQTSKHGTDKANTSWGWTWLGSGKAISNWNWMPFEPEKREGHDYVVINYPTRYFQTYPANGLLYAACETRIGWPMDSY